MAQNLIPKRWHMPLCWGSVMLNLVLIAVLVVRPGGLFMPPPPPPDEMISQMGRNLDGADKAVFDAVLAKNIDEIKLHGERMHTAFEQMRLDLARDPFDADRLTAARVRTETARARMDALIFSALLEVLEDISPEGRKKLSEFPRKRP